MHIGNCRLHDTMNKDKQYRQTVTIACIGIMLILSGCTFGRGDVTAEKGVLDLNHLDLREVNWIELTGTWEFYRGRHIPPNKFNSEEKSEPEYIPVPRAWNTFTPGKITASSLNVATYRLRVILDKPYERLSIKMPDVGMAYRLFVNGKPRALCGKPGKTYKTTRPKLMPMVIDLKSQGNELDIVLHVSNFHNLRGGIWFSPDFGVAEKIHRLRDISLATDIILLGSFFIMGLTYLVLFFIRKEDRSALYFSIFCFIWAVRSIIAGERFAAQIFPNLDWVYLDKIESITIFLLPMVLALFLHSVFPREFKKLSVRFFQMTSMVLILSVVLFQPIVYRNIEFIFSMVVFIGITYTLYVLIIAMKRSRDGALPFLIGFIAILLTYTNDILYDNLAISSIHLIDLGFLCFMFSQGVLISYRYARTHRQVENLSRHLEMTNIELIDLNINLEKKVSDRTADLKSALEELEETNDLLVETRDALWGEMQLAKKIQTTLVPDSPSIEGYELAAYMEPADEVGGDYFDIIQSHGKDWVVIGDVSGHGVSAGLVMMMLQTAIHTVIMNFPGLGTDDLIVMINQVLTRNLMIMKEDKYVTMTVLLAHGNGDFHFSGLHQDILVFRRETGVVEQIQTNGIWLGLLETIDGRISEESLHLNQGDVMLLFTDGIVESWLKGSVVNRRDPSTEMFGKNRLRGILSSTGNDNVREIKRKLLSELENYEHSDDIAFIILKKS